MSKHAVEKAKKRLEVESVEGISKKELQEFRRRVAELEALCGKARAGIDVTIGEEEKQIEEQRRHIQEQRRRIEEQQQQLEEQQQKIDDTKRRVAQLEPAIE